ncbi:MAG: hypothetical protein MI919_38990, partial [Holophagales bacterium]|nr:hypothetical protein [Holophagales bacterium]
MKVRGSSIPVWLVAGSVLVSPMVSGESPVQVVGQSTRVNQFAPGDQGEPAVAGLGDRFAVVWTSPDGADSGGPGVFLRYLSAASGEPQGSDLRLSGVGAAAVGAPDVAATRNGGLVVAWIEERNAMASVMGVLVSGAGVVGIPFPLEQPSDSPAGPRIAAHRSGRFVTVWRSGGLFFEESVKGGLYDAAGTRIRPLFSAAASPSPSPLAPLGLPRAISWHPAFFGDGSFSVVFSLIYGVDDWAIHLWDFEPDGSAGIPPSRRVNKSAGFLFSCGRLAVAPDDRHQVVYIAEISSWLFRTFFDSDRKYLGGDVFGPLLYATCIEVSYSPTTDTVVLAGAEGYDDGVIYAQLDGEEIATRGRLTAAGLEPRIAR